MNKNRSYPGAFKSIIQSKILQKKDISKPLQKQLKKGEGKIENKYPNNSIPKYKKYFRDKLLGLCESKMGKIILTEKFRENFPQEISDLQNQYYFQARKILQEEDSGILMKEVDSDYEHLGLIICNKLYCDGGSEYTKKLENLSDVEQKIYDDYIFNLDGFDDSKYSNFRQYFAYILEKNPENKYEFLERAIQNISENIQKPKQKEGFYNNNNKSDQKFPESLFSMEHFGDENKNKIIFLQLIEVYDGKVNFSNIEYLHLTKDSDKLEIVEALIGYQQTIGMSHEGIRSLVENFDKIGISDEKIRFEIAKKVANLGSILGDFLEKFSITNQDYLTELAKIHSETNIVDNTINNTNFINIAYKFGDEILNNYEINSQTINRDTYINLESFLKFPQEIQIKLFQDIFLYCANLEENIEVFFRYIFNREKSFQDKIISQIGEKVLLNQSKNKILGFCKDVKNKNKNYEEIYNKIILQSFIGAIKNEKIHIILHNLHENNIGSNKVSHFNYKEDMDIFIQALVIENKISLEEKQMIETQMLYFNNMRDFLMIFFIKNENEKERNPNFIPIEYDINQNPRENSLDYIFDMIGLQQPNGLKNIDKSKMKGFESILFKLYNNLGVDFLEKIDFGGLNLDEISFEIFKKIFNLLNILSHAGSKSNYCLVHYELNVYFSHTDLFDMKSIKQMKNSLDIITNYFEEKNISGEYLEFNFLEIIDYFDKNWGTSENIMRLLVNLSSNPEVYKKLCQTINAIIKGNFQEYKFHGLEGDQEDQIKAQNQLSMMNQEEIVDWKKDRQEIIFDSTDKNVDYKFVDSNIQNSFLRNTNIGEYLNVKLSEKQELIIENISDRVTSGEKFDNIFPELENISVIKIKEIIFYIFSQAQKQYQFKNIIKFIKRFYEKNQEKKDEFISFSNTYLQYLKEFEKTNKKTILLGINSSHPRTLLEVGSITSDNSCLDINDNKGQLPALLGYVIDANVKVFLMFEITQKNCKNFHQYKKINDSLEINPNNFLFDENTRELTVGGEKIILNKAVRRNMIFKGVAGNTNEVGTLVEKSYGQNNNLDRLGKLQSSLFGISYNSNIKLYPSRNPGGVYSDIQNKVLKTEG